MKSSLPLSIIVSVSVSILLFAAESKTLDPYKVLGLDRSANQREIQKAFHKLSLQYHPDKNKNKGAQEKFAEINNAYEILSDEEKRKNYDLYGDEKGASGFDPGNAGQHGGYTYFTSGGPGQSGFTFRPGDWQNMGGQGGSKSFSFSFGGPSGQRSSGFGLDDIFSNFFGGEIGGSQFGGFGSSARSQYSRAKSSTKSIPSVNSQVYRKEIADKGITWLLLSYTSNSRGIQYYESLIPEAAASLRGALRVGSVNCDTETSFCKELGIHPHRTPRLLIYSYKSSESGNLVEFNNDLDAKNLKNFCQEHLPRFSKRVNLDHFDFAAETVGALPKVMLLSTKRDTPVIWRALSGLYHKSFIFYDVEVHDGSDPRIRRLGVDAFPALVGWLSNGDKHILKTGISVKDLQSAIKDLSALLDKFEKMNKKAAPKSKKTETESGGGKIPLLTAYNFDDICGQETPVCIIGAFRTSKARDKLEDILSMVSQKSLSRRRNIAFSSKDSVSYALLDAAKQQSFLAALDKSGFNSVDQLLVAYKPRKGKFATLKGALTAEEVEKFIGSVLNGDVQFTKSRQKPTVK